LKGIDYCPPKWKAYVTFMLQWAILNAATYLVTLSLGN